MGVRVYPDIPRAYVDLDGTAFDLEAAAVAAGMPIAEMKHRRGAYRNLPLIAGAIEAIAALSEAGYLVFFATKIPKENPYAATEKLLQVTEVFPEVGERVIITPDKGCIGTPRDILIDDRPEWANAHAFPGRIFKFNGDWRVVVEWARKVKRELDAMGMTGSEVVSVHRDNASAKPVAAANEPAQPMAVSAARHPGPRC